MVLKRFLALFGLLTVLVSSLGFAQTAAAAPAQPISTSECSTSDYGVELCFEAHGVVRETTSASGTTTYSYNMTSSTTASQNGQVFYEAEDRNHVTVVTVHGEEQVYHVLGSGSFTNLLETGETCTYTYNIIVANGDIRHLLRNAECS